MDGGPGVVSVATAVTQPLLTSADPVETRTGKRIEVWSADLVGDASGGLATIQFTRRDNLAQRNRYRILFASGGNDASAMADHVLTLVVGPVGNTLTAIQVGVVPTSNAAIPRSEAPADRAIRDVQIPFGQWLLQLVTTNPGVGVTTSFRAVIEVTPLFPA